MQRSEMGRETSKRKERHGGGGGGGGVGVGGNRARQKSKKTISNGGQRGESPVQN